MMITIFALVAIIVMKAIYDSKIDDIYSQAYDRIAADYYDGKITEKEYWERKWILEDYLGERD